MSEGDKSLSGSEQFMLISMGIAAFGACVASLFQFVLRSRCKMIKCGCVELEREVLPPNQSQLDTTQLSSIGTST